MTRARITLLLVVALALGIPGVAAAADPIMPLSELRAGMQCKSYSVIRGTEPTEFDVEILDIVEGDTASDGPRILVRASGPAVEPTGIGFGFSGSPIYCRDGQGTARNAGAISESLGARDGLTVLATPIETMLGNPPDAPAGARAAPAGARSLATPLTISGLTGPLREAVMEIARKAGRPVLASPARPLHGFPVTPPKPGSAVSVGYSTGALALGGIGTVSYVDGDRVWAFGHPLDGAGGRSLLLQDAYVYGVIPGGPADVGGPYKLAAPGHDLGAFTNDAITAIVGRTGPLPATVPVTVRVKDLDTGAERTDVTRVADETVAGQPLGASPLSFVAPFAVGNAGTILKGSPARVSGDMCLRVVLEELPAGARICNRYVFAGLFGVEAGIPVNLAAGLAASDVIEVMALIDGYRFADLHVKELTARLELRRGTGQAFMREVRLPRSAKAGSRIPVKIDLVHAGGRKETITETVRLPRRPRRGLHELTFTGTDSDDGAGDIFGALTTLLLGDEGDEDTGGDPGPATIEELRRAIRRVERWDGVRLRVDRRRGQGRKAFRNADLRLSGRVRGFIRLR